MLELIKLAIEKPLQAVVAALCMVVIAHQTGLVKVNEAVAVLQSEQKADNLSQAEVKLMRDSLIRIESSVDQIKSHQEEVTAYVRKEVEYQLLKSNQSGEHNANQKQPEQ